MRLQLTAGHFLQQFRTRLDFARIFAEVQHGAEFTARQLVLLTIGAYQRAAIDIQLPAVELIAFHATALFAHGTQVHGTGEQVARADRQFTWVERFSDIIIGANFEAKDFIHFVIAAGEEHQRDVRLLTQFAC